MPRGKGSRVIASEVKPTSVRIPQEEYERIVAQAEKERRTVHNMILVLLSEALDRRQQEPKK